MITIETTFTYSGKLWIEAENEEEALSIVHNSFGVLNSPSYHDTDNRIINWEFDMMPEQKNKISPTPDET